jgi:hypothetical protein
MGGRPQRIYWRILGIDRQTRERFERDIVLDTAADKVPAEDLNDIVRMVAEQFGDRAIVKHRRHFREMASDDEPTRFELTHDFAMFCVPDYYEDENGCEISKVEFRRADDGAIRSDSYGRPG